VPDIPAPPRSEAIGVSTVGELDQAVEYGGEEWLDELVASNHTLPIVHPDDAEIALFDGEGTRRSDWIPFGERFIPEPETDTVTVTRVAVRSGGVVK
jgi:hypothetical protein